MNLTEREFVGYLKESKQEGRKEVAEYLKVKLHVGGHGKVGGKYHQDYMGLTEDEMNTLLEGKILNQK